MPVQETDGDPLNEDDWLRFCEEGDVKTEGLGGPVAEQGGPGGALLCQISESGAPTCSPERNDSSGGWETCVQLEGIPPKNAPKRLKLEGFAAEVSFGENPLEEMLALRMEGPGGAERNPAENEGSGNGVGPCVDGGEYDGAQGDDEGGRAETGGIGADGSKTGLEAEARATAEGSGSQAETVHDKNGTEAGWGDLGRKVKERGPEMEVGQCGIRTELVENLGAKPDVGLAGDGMPERKTEAERTEKPVRGPTWQHLEGLVRRPVAGRRHGKLLAKKKLALLTRLFALLLDFRAREFAVMALDMREALRAHPTQAVFDSLAEAIGAEFRQVDPGATVELVDEVRKKLKQKPMRFHGKALKWLEAAFAR